MKKFLSLVLALVMTMSLVTVSAGAKDFTDGGKINYDEAVAVVSAIGVVDGYKDGAFNPQNTLTRGAAAKIICNLVLGPTTASALSADAAPFKDVPANHEFAGYIAYCAQQGIINGYADGTFRPAGTLNGYAFMKMLLGALGYDGKIEGFTGANWTVQVAKLALGNKLNSGNDEFDGNQAVTREEACLYAFNTLKADMVEYDSKITANVNGAEVTIGNSKAEVAKQGVYDDTMGKDGLQFAERYFPKLTKTKNDTDPFGRPANEWKYKANVIGSYADYSDLLETYTAKAKRGDLFSLIGSSVVNDLGKKNGYDFTVYVDGAEVTSPAASDYFVKNSSAAAGVKDATKGTGVSGNGVVTEVYMDDDNNVTIVMVNTWLVKATADYNSTKETLNVEIVDINTDSDKKSQNVIVPPALTTTIDNDDVYVADFKEDDYILVTYSYMDKEIESAVKAEVVTGEVSEFTETSEVIMDGTTYKYNKLVGDTESGVEYTIGADAKVVLDEYGYIIFVDEALSTSSYVFVLETAKATGVGNKVAADVYFTDGTNDSVIIKKVNGDSDYASKAAAKGAWYTFSKSGDDYSLTSPKSPVAQTSVDFKDRNTKLIVNDKVQFMPKVDGNYTYDKKDVANSAIKGNSSTIFVVLEANGDVTAYTGIKNAPEITTSGSVKAPGVQVYVSLKGTTGYAQYVFVDLTNDPKASVEDSNNAADYLFLLKKTGNKTTSGEDTYYKYKVVIDGQETEKFVEESLTGKDGAGMLFRNVKENAKGYITGATKFDDAAKRDIVTFSEKTIKFDKDTLSIAGSDYVIADDCKVTLALGKNANLDIVNEGDDYTLYNQTSARTAAGVLSNYKLDGTAYVTVDDDDSMVATSIYIWIDNAEPSDEKDDGGKDIDADNYLVVVNPDNPYDLAVLAYSGDGADTSVAAKLQAVKNYLSKKGTVESSKYDSTAKQYEFVVDGDVYTWKPDEAENAGVKVRVGNEDLLVPDGSSIADVAEAAGIEKVGTYALVGNKYVAVTEDVEDGETYKVGFTSADVMDAVMDDAMTKLSKDAALVGEDKAITELTFDGTELHLEVSKEVSDTGIVGKLESALGDIVKGDLAKAKFTWGTEKDKGMTEILGAIKTDLNGKITEAAKATKDVEASYEVTVVMEDESTATYTLSVYYTYVAPKA